MKKTLKSIALAFACVLGVVGLASCGEPAEPAHEHSYEYQSDATKHRQVCKDCDEATIWEAHKWGEWVETKAPTLDEKGSHYRVCSVCEYKATEDIDQLTPTTGETSEDWTNVYVQVPTDWTDANIHYFNKAGNGNLSDDYVSSWPGKAMTKVDETNRIYGFQLPKGVDGIVFNTNGGKPQTVDLKWSPDRNMFVLGEADAEGKLTATYKSYTAKDSDPVLAKPEKNVPVEYVTMYVQLPEAWDRCNIHFWGTVKDSSWPGVAMTKVEGKENVWSFDKVVKGATGFVVNSKVDSADETNPKTGDITSVPEGTNAFIVTKDGDNYVGAPAKYENGEFTALEVKVDKTITELYVRGDMNGWAAADAQKLTIKDNVASIEIELTAGQKFKVAGKEWSTNWSTFGYADTLGAAFSGEAGGDITVVTGGTYVIKVENLQDGETPVFTITPKGAAAEPTTLTLSYVCDSAATVIKNELNEVVTLDDKGVITLYSKQTDADKLWLYEAKSGKKITVDGAEVTTKGRIKQQSGNNYMEIDLTDYTGSVTLVMNFAAAGSGERSIFIVDSANLDGDKVFNLTTTESGLHTNTITLECGKKYTLKTTNGFNFFSFEFDPVTTPAA